MSEKIADMDDDTWITGAQMRQDFGGITANTVMRWRTDPTLGFPQPIELNGRQYWKAAELREWRRAQAAKIVRPAPVAA